MNLPEKSKQLLLAAILLIVIIAGSTVFIFNSGEGNEKIVDNELASPKKETYYVEKLIREELGIYESIAPIFANYGVNIVKIAFPQDGEKLLSMINNAYIMDMPKDFFPASGYCIDKNMNFVTVNYDSGNKGVVVKAIDMEGNMVKNPVFLDGFAGTVFDGSYIKIEEFKVDDKYIYLLSRTNTQPTLQIFTREGQLHATYPMTNSFDVDYKGGLFISHGINEENKTYGFKKIDIDSGEVKYEIGLKLVPDLIRYHEKEEKIYSMDVEGITTYLADDGKIIGEIFTFGEDSTYMGDAYPQKKFIVGAEEDIYIALTYFEEGIGPVNLYYRYELMEGVREEKPVTLTITAAYRHDFMADAIRRYELKYPDEKIEYDYRFNSRQEYMDNSEQYGQQLTLNILTGDIGDIVMTGGGGAIYRELFKTDAFEDLAPLIEEDKNYESLNKNALEGIRMDGTIRGLPVSMVYYLYEINTTLANSIGLELDYNDFAWNDVLDLIPVLEEKAPDNYLFIDMGEGYPLLDILIANMPQLIDLEKKEVNLRQQWFIEMLEDYKTAYESNNFLQNNHQFDMIDMLHESLFCFRGTDALDYRDMIYRFMEYNLNEERESLYIPVFTGELSNNRVAYSNNMYSINSKSQNKEKAWKFLSFLLEDEIQMIRSLPGKPINTRADRELLENAARELKNTYGDETYKFVDMMTNISEKIDYLYDMDYFKLDIYTPIQRYVEGEWILEEALKQAEENVWIRLHE